MKLSEYVAIHTVRGACKCGKCIDAPDNPEQHQPLGHTADVIFFMISNGGAEREVFENMVKKEFPHWLDGKEHSYLETGADMGDQGIALATMGLGKILGVWELLTPRSILGSLVDTALIMTMAGQGYITIKRVTSM